MQCFFYWCTSVNGKLAEGRVWYSILVSLLYMYMPVVSQLQYFESHWADHMAGHCHVASNKHTKNGGEFVSPHDKSVDQ